MPRAFDQRQLNLSHDPSRRISQELARTPDFVAPPLSGLLLDLSNFMADSLAWLEEVFTPFFDDFNKLVSDINAWLLDTFDPLVDKVQSIIDAIIQGFHAWWEQNGFTEQDIKDFSNNVAQAIGTIGTLGIRLSKLEGAGSKILEDFTTYPNDALALGPQWFQYYQGAGGGTLGIVNDYAVFSLALGTNNKTGIALHKTSTASDLHRVAAPVSTPQSGAFERSANLLIARAALVAGTDMVFARLEGGKAEIGFVKAGATTILMSNASFKFKNGAVYSLDCTELRTFKLFENDTLMLTAVDSAAQSTISDLNRFVGFGVYAPNNLLRPGVYGSLAGFVK